MGIFKEEESMRKESTAKNHAAHGFTQFELTNYLLNNLSQFNITPTAKLVLLELSTHYNPNNPDMFPKQKTLAVKIGVSERSVVRAISELFKEGLIIIECKYTNRYKFTSRIATGAPQNDKKNCLDKMSDDLRQNDIKQSDNLSQHEQTKEHIKKPLKIEDYKLLKEYAEGKNAKNIKAYINKLIENNSAKKIIKELKQRDYRKNAYLNATKEYIEQGEKDAKTAEGPGKAWVELKTILKNKNIKGF